jgi:hypothetical protein
MIISVSFKNVYYFNQINILYSSIFVLQRGMGRSWPSFYHEKCDSIDIEQPDDDGKYSGADIQEYLDGRKDDVERCWGCTDCDYQFNDFEQPDGEDPRSFHFLECKSIIVFFCIYYFQ